MAAEIPRGIQGFKARELDAKPEEVFEGDSPFQREELPEGVRLFLREKKLDLAGKKLSVNVYRLESGGLKDRRIFAGKFEPRQPQDDEIAERFGKGRFIWIMKWLGADNQERGIISEEIEIGEEGQALHEEWLRRQRGNPIASSVAQAQTAPPAVSAVSGAPLTALDMMALMEKAEEKAMNRLERILALTQSGRSDVAGSVLKDAYQGANEMMMAAVKTNLEIARMSGKAAQSQMMAELQEEDEEEALPASPGGLGFDGPTLPAWLQPFMPLVEKGIEKLFAGGPVAGAVKTLILSSDEWQQIFSDPEKWGQAVAAMEQKYGSEKTKRALDILLAKEGKAAKVAKGLAAAKSAIRKRK